MCVHAITLLLSLILTHCSNAQQPDLSYEQLAKRGKDATALVVINGRGIGTAFCVERQGWFITNQHVIKGVETAKGEVKLILNSGLKSEKVVKARVIRHEDKQDLALLRADEKLDLDALELSPSEKLSELTEVIAFGFPFGSAMSLDRAANPTISVNVGKVTALRRKSGELQFVQVDAALNPGNSGGPLLNRQGKVVGIVVAGIDRSGVNLAIPSEFAITLMDKPDIQFHMPSIARNAFDRPVEFKANVISLQKPVQYEAKLHLQLDDQPERVIPMKLEDGQYRAQAVPVPISEKPKLLTISATFDDSSLTAKASDATITVNGKPVPLRDIKRLQFTPQMTLTMRDGVEHKNDQVRCESIVVLLGGKEITLDTKKLKEVRITLDPSPQNLTARISILKDGKEIASASETLALPGEETARKSITKSEPVQQPRFDQAKLERKLPATIDDAVLGGGGRYIILSLPKVRQVAVFDVSEARVVKYIPADDDDVHIAASQEKLFIAWNKSKQLQRWDLKSLTRDITVPLPCSRVHFLLLGYASHGPLIVSMPRENDNGTLFLNIDTLKEIPVTGSNKIGYDERYGSQWRVSGEGTVITGWSWGISPPSLVGFVLNGRTLNAYGTSVAVKYVRPGPDGKVLFTTAGLFTQEYVSLNGGTASHRWSEKYPIPATSGDWYLVCAPANEARPRFGKSTPLIMNGSLHLTGPAGELASLPHLDLNEIPFDMPYSNKLQFDKRVIFVPDAKVVVTIPGSNDRLVVQKIDVDEALEKSAIDYLFFSSQPVTRAVKGVTYQYQMSVRSRKGAVKYRLDAAPEGMKLSPQGEISWPIPADYEANSADVIVTVTDASGQESTQTFRITLGAGKDMP